MTRETNAVDRAPGRTKPGAVKLVASDIASLLYVARNLRAEDAEECFALAASTPDDLVLLTLGSGAFQWVAVLDGVPAASFGARMLHPGVWAAWMFATDDWPRVALTVTRFVIKVLKPTLLHSGAHRVECLSCVSHDNAGRWLELIGARREGVLRRRGRQGQDFVSYAWTPEQ